MAGSRVPRQLFLQGVAAIFMVAFASLYTQIPGLYGTEGILPARRTLRPQGKGRWQQLWETPTLLWEAPRLGLDTAQGLELLTLLGTLLALGTLLMRQLRHPLTYLLLWAAYLSVCQASGAAFPHCWTLPLACRGVTPHPLSLQVGQVFLYFQWDSLLLETGFLAVLVAPLRQPPRRRPEAAWPHEDLPFWLVRWLLFRLMFASGVVKLTSRCPAWWGLTALTYHYETQCLPTPAAWAAHHLPVWLHRLSVVATFLIEVAVPPLFFAPVRRLRLAAFYAQVLLQVLIIITGNYNFFNLLTLVLTSALLDDTHLGAGSGNKKTPACECPLHPTAGCLTCGPDIPGAPSSSPTSDPAAGAPGPSWPPVVSPIAWPKALLAALPLLLELAVYGLLAYGTVLCFGLEADWEQGTVLSRTTFTFHQFSQWLKTVTLPTMWLGAASLAWELLTALWRWTQLQGWSQKLCAAAPLSVLSTATAVLFLISLVPYSYLEPSTHGRLWTGAHRLFGSVEHLQLANSYGLFRRMTGLGGRPEVVLEGSYDGQHWTEIEFLYKPGNVSRPPPVVTPHQPRLDWQMWFAALGPHTHSPWFSSLVLRLLQGREPVIRLIQTDLSRYPFHKQPPTYIRAQLYKYWFSQPGEQGKWWRRQWVEEFFPPVSLGDPTLDTLLRQFGLQDKSPPRARGSSNALTQTLHWLRERLSPLEAPTLLWGLLATVGAIWVLQALLDPPAPRPAPPARDEKQRPVHKKDSGTSGQQAAPAPNSCSSGPRPPRRKK
ncbi:Lipase maturation factor 2 [Galemys pyrenaicus]|uniref:Lipase maturation factor n=1 Tax=Galemys pyrenaicus TaxID=202257 RepID=A0A8J6AC60_GALPY|nr:Lipase maturation factor 2 [Galemys pyrenaicus]